MLTCIALFLQIVIEAQSTFNICTVDGIRKVAYDCRIEEEPDDCNGRDRLVNTLFCSETRTAPFEKPKQEADRDDNYR